MRKGAMRTSSTLEAPARWKALCSVIQLHNGLRAHSWWSYDACIGQSSCGGTGVPILAHARSIAQSPHKPPGRAHLTPHGGNTAPVVQRPVAMRSRVDSLQL